ncbi:hypothetical protein EV361DRAFT_954851 [Lentinula raphanica]|nr:hypothetical protein EV361DRAFT_954851 [Lentinula raphanica]
MVSTGFEIPVIIAVARSALKSLNSQSTSQLYKRATEILDDHGLIKLHEKLYELNEKLADENHDRYKEARSICDSIETSDSADAQNVFTRHMEARRAYRMAVSYRTYVKKNTADALQKALRDKRQRKNKHRATSKKSNKAETKVYNDPQSNNLPLHETSPSSTGDLPSAETTDHADAKDEGRQFQRQRHQPQRFAARHSGHLHRSFSFGIFPHDIGTPENPIMFLSADCLPDRIPEGAKYGIIVVDGKSNLGSVNAGHENTREQVASQRSPVEDHDISEGSQHIQNEEPESSYGKRGSNSYDTPDSKDVAEAARVVITAITTYDDEDDDKAISIATSFTFDLDNEGSNGKGLSNDENYDSDEDEDSEVNESDYESFESEDDENKREEAVDDDLEA